MDTSTWVILSVFIVLITILFTKRSNGKKVLPGPIGLPIVGYLPFMTSSPHLKLTELGKKYGPIYKFRLGSKNIVVMCNHHLIREAFLKEDFSGRPNDNIFQPSETTIKLDVISGLNFKEQRRFSLHVLRDLGFGKTRMEDHIKEEILELIDLLSANGPEPVLMNPILTACAANNISSLLFGRRLKMDDPDRMKLDFCITEVTRLAGSTAWHQFFPWLLPIIDLFPNGQRKQLGNALKGIRAYCRKEMNAHEKTLDPDNVRDFIDGYLLEIEKRKDEPNTTFHKDVLVDMATGFYGAGTGTIRTTTDWLLLLCAARPDIQKNVQQEIDEVLGDRFVTGMDRPNMPYTEAVICEIMRWRSAIPLNLLRRTVKDTEVGGYFIPKDTEVLAVFWAVDHDENVWGKDVMEFKPERFLSEDRKKVVKPEYFFPFSTGKRSCPGKPLGEVEVFLFFVALLQKFDLFPSPGKKIDLEGFLGIGLETKRQKIVLKKRNLTSSN